MEKSDVEKEEEIKEDIEEVEGSWGGGGRRRRRMK